MFPNNTISDASFWSRKLNPLSGVRSPASAGSKEFRRGRSAGSRNLSPDDKGTSAVRAQPLSLPGCKPDSESKFFMKQCQDKATGGGRCKTSTGEGEETVDLYRPWLRPTFHNLNQSEELAGGGLAGQPKPDFLRLRPLTAEHGGCVS